jgi:hypothetical protein
MIPRRRVEESWLLVHPGYNTKLIKVYVIVKSTVGWLSGWAFKSKA